MRSVAPAADLAPFVRELMLVDVDEVTTRVHLPEPGLTLGVRYCGAASVLREASYEPLANATLAGIMSRPRRMRTEAGSGVLLARFHPGGAAAFLDVPLHEVAGVTMALDELFPRAEVERLRSQVIEAATDARRVAVLEAFLRHRRREVDPLVPAALRALEAARGGVRIRELARRLAVSQDTLEKRFRRAVGASPKHVASLLRLRHAIAAHRPGASLAQLAQEAGYFDQSHFHRELRAATGESPARFFASQNGLRSETMHVAREQRR